MTGRRASCGAYPRKGHSRSGTPRGKPGTCLREAAFPPYGGPPRQGPGDWRRTCSSAGQPGGKNRPTFPPHGNAADAFGMPCLMKRPSFAVLPSSHGEEGAGPSHPGAAQSPGQPPHVDAMPASGRATGGRHPPARPAPGARPKLPLLQYIERKGYYTFLHRRAKTRKLLVPFALSRTGESLC